jgi:D-tyrosyl-tRNA(Tyr) deacylase
MRVVVQRVSTASVSVGGKVVGEIGKGFFILLGVGQGDTEKKAEELANKLLKMRLMAGSAGKMDLSVKDVGAEVLVVSQFTLYADTSKGNRPSFLKAASPEEARKLYDHFVKELVKLGVGVRTGRFGEYMKINAELDGPVTIALEN